MKWPPSFMLYKRPLLRIQITYGYGYAFFKCQADSVADEGLHFVIAYVLFLARFFYACEKRHVVPVASVLTDHLQSYAPPNQLTSDILQAVYRTFTKMEKSAFDDQFKYPLLPPTIYAEDLGDVDSIEGIGQYTFGMFKKSGCWQCDLQISLGFNLVLLPLTVGLLYNYVTDRITDEETAILKACITDFLLLIPSSNYRSYRFSTKAANKVIHNHLGACRERLPKRFA